MADEMEIDGVEYRGEVAAVNRQSHLHLQEEMAALASRFPLTMGQKRTHAECVDEMDVGEDFVASPLQQRQQQQHQQQQQQQQKQWRHSLPSTPCRSRLGPQAWLEQSRANLFAEGVPRLTPEKFRRDGRCASSPKEAIYTITEMETPSPTPRPTLVPRRRHPFPAVSPQQQQQQQQQYVAVDDDHDLDLRPRRIIGMLIVNTFIAGATAFDKAMRILTNLYQRWTWTAPEPAAPTAEEGATDATGATSPASCDEEARSSDCSTIVIDAVATDRTGRKRRAVDASPSPLAYRSVTSLLASSSPNTSQNSTVATSDKTSEAPSRQPEADQKTTQPSTSSPSPSIAPSSSSIQKPDTQPDAQKQMPTPPSSRPSSSECERASPKPQLTYMETVVMNNKRFEAKRAALMEAQNKKSLEMSRQWAREREGIMEKYAAQAREEHKAKKEREARGIVIPTWSSASILKNEDNKAFRARRMALRKAQLEARQIKTEASALSKTEKAKAPTPSKEIKDNQIDALVSKAREVAIESPEQKRARQALQLKKQQELEAKKAADDAERQKAIELALSIQLAREAEEARIENERLQKAAEEAAIKAAQLAAEQRKQVIQNLSDKREQDIQHAMDSSRGKNGPITKAIGGYELRRDVFERITAERGGAASWLNDEAVNSWFEAIVQRKKEQTGYVRSAKAVPAYAAFNTTWYNNATKKGVSGIANWARRQHVGKEKLLECEKLFMPVNIGGAHWALLLISGTDRTIQYLDSFGSKGENVLETARQFLVQELGKLYNADEWKQLKNTSSMQNNNNDCGVFACFNGLAAAKNQPSSSVQQARMAHARRMMAAVLLNRGFTEEFEL